MDEAKVNVELDVARMFQHHRSIAVYATTYDSLGKTVCAVHSPVFEEIGPFQQRDPLVTMSEESAQLLFQSLWDMNFRPKSQDGNVGMLSATQDHLADMRKIAAKKIGVKL
jgi:hypothetical protein